LQSAVDEGSTRAGCALPVSGGSEAFAEALGARHASNEKSKKIVLVAFMVPRLAGCHDDAKTSVKFQRNFTRKETKPPRKEEAPW
jgi:hypothetical protein